MYVGGGIFRGVREGDAVRVCPFRVCDTLRTVRINLYGHIDYSTAMLIAGRKMYCQTHHWLYLCIIITQS